MVSMIKVHNITPRTYHYVCMIDFLGHVGHLEDADKFINNMLVEPNVETWGHCFVLAESMAV